MAEKSKGVVDLGGITVVKESGEKEEFDPQKVKDALRRSGVSGKLADEVVDMLRPKLRDGITTKKIYQIVAGMIKDMRPEALHKYNLKRALFEIGPAGYEFEDFTSRLLSLQGYSTQIRQILNGKCVSHEIDLVAERKNDVYMVECKFHNEPGARCRIQTALYVYARYLDLVEGAKLGLCKSITRPWLITNTKFSDDVLKYAECMDMPLLGWHHPLDNSLEAMIDKTGCYPVTVIPVHRDIIGRLLGKKIVTVFDIPESAQKLSEVTGIPPGKAKEIVELAAYAR